MDPFLLKIEESYHLVRGMPYGSEAMAVAVFLFFLMLRAFFTRIVMSFARNLAKRTPTTIDDEIVEASEAPIKFLFIVIGLSIALNLLKVPDNWDALRYSFNASLYTYSLFWFLFCMVPPLLKAVFCVGSRFGNNFNQDLLDFFIRAMGIIIIVIGAVAILEQWDINVSAFLGGLGLMGMAVALAARDTIANMFGTLVIFTDRTFHRGDWIQTPNVEGTVEHIGLRACKVRTFAKALVNVPNAEIVNSPITNWSRMTNRRIRLTIGLEYRTTAQQLERIVERLRTFLAEDPTVEIKGPVPQMVHLDNFSASSIDIDLYYFTKTINWEEYRQVKSDHIIAFKKIVEEEGAAFAFPSRTVYVDHGNAAPQPGVFD